MTQYEMEMAAQDLAHKKQQKEELATGVILQYLNWEADIIIVSVSYKSCCFAQWKQWITVCVCAQTVRVFSLKGMTSKLFGQESQEQRESRLAVLEQSIREGEAALKERNAECQ